MDHSPRSSTPLPGILKVEYPSMITLEHIPVPNPAVASQLMDGEAVLVHPMQGKVKVLNDVGAFIWKSLDGCTSAAGIASAVTAAYAVSRETAEQDTLHFLESLLARQLISIESR